MLPEANRRKLTNLADRRKQWLESLKEMMKEQVRELAKEVSAGMINKSTEQHRSAFLKYGML